MGASALRGNCTVIHSVDVQLLGMSCEDCDAKFSILKRRRTCCDCSHDFCSSCVSRIKGLEKRHRCRRCHVFSLMPFDRNAIMGLKIRHLRWFLHANSVPMNGCKEKSELVDLVVNHLRLKEAASHYPQNFERRTVAPEYLVCDSPVGSSENSPIRSVNTHPHYPGPSSTTAAQMNTGSLRARSVCPDDIEDIEVTYSSIHLPAGGSENPLLDDDEVQIIAENVVPMPSVEVAVHDIEEDAESSDSQHEDAESQAQQHIEKPSTTAVAVQDLESIEDIDSLSVMQLKLILTRNFVNYKGCCEKQELQEKVRNLWTQKQKAKDVDSIPDENICRICMEAAIDSVLLECGHVVTCTECGKRLHECPICRQYIIRVVHIFKA